MLVSKVDVVLFTIYRNVTLKLSENLKNGWKLSVFNEKLENCGY